MKNSVSVTFILFFLCIYIAEAQQFFVLQVKGSVKDVRTGRLLKTNDILKSSDKITFSSEQDAVAIVSSKLGRFVLRPGIQKKDSESMVFVKDVLTPSSNKLSTRSGERFKNVVDFQSYFSEPILLIKSNIYRVDTSNFELSDKAFFFIRYFYKGVEINKKLSSMGEGFAIKRDELYRVDGNVVDSREVNNLVLCHMRLGKYQKLAELFLCSPDLIDLRQEVDLLKRSIDSPDSSKAFFEVKSYLQEFYGRIDENDLVEWLGE